MIEEWEKCWHMWNLMPTWLMSSKFYYAFRLVLIFRHFLIFGREYNSDPLPFFFLDICRHQKEKKLEKNDIEGTNYPVNQKRGDDSIILLLMRPQNPACCFCTSMRRRFRVVFRQESFAIVMIYPSINTLSFAPVLQKQRTSKTKYKLAN